MIREACLMAMLAAALGQPLAAQARGFDPLRCEAIEMRKEGQRFACLARCDRRDGRREEPSEAKLAKCQEGCETRYENSMDRLEGRDVCGGDVDTTDPNRCHARLMRAGATQLTCEARCSTRAAARETFDETSCIEKCDDHHTSTVDHIMAKPYCAGMELTE